jgi:uncharacterized protein YjbJ (UPF0337 family)
MTNRLENGKDRIIGNIKETAGRITDNEGMEFKGKVQTIKSDIGDKAADIKDNVLEKVNDLIDRGKAGKNSKQR